MNTQHPPEKQLSAIVEDLADYIQFEQEEGRKTIPLVHPITPLDVHALTAAPSADHGNALETIAREVRNCRKCRLHETRTHAVPGQGCPTPRIVFIGEGPGADEDAKGIAFIGRAGQLLTKIIESMGLTREEVWIGNIVKCRPPGNRAPQPDEMGACMPYLKQQLVLLQPEVIVCLGGTAIKGLLGTKQGITKLRGTWMTFEGIDVMPTFHPAYLLRDPRKKKYVWADMKEVLSHLGLPIPQPTG